MKTCDAKNNIFQYVNLGLQRKLNRVDAKTLRWRNDPIAFFREKLGAEIWSGAQDAMMALASSATARVSVVAGHGVQKTFTAAHAALWFSYCWRPSKVITTAPTGRQVEKLLWSDIRKTYAKAIRQDPLYPGRMLTCEWKAAPDWFMYGFSSEDPIACEGFHGENVLIIVDEAKGVKDLVFEGLEGALSGTNARVMYISTAGHPEGEFYESQSNPLFEKFHFSCEDMVDYYEKIGLPPPPGCTTRRWIEERKDRWGEDSQRYKMRIKALFCEEVLNAIVPYEWVQRALSQPIRRGGKVRIGVDIGEEGDDPTVIFVGDDYGDIEVDITDKQEATETAGKVIQYIKKYKVFTDDVKLDRTGVGSGTGSILREKGYDIDCVHFAEKATDKEEYADIITEMYWGLRKQFENPYFRISDIPELIEDITKRKYSVNSDGAYKIEPKKEFKKRVKRSCDCGDAAALCYFDNSLRSVGVGNRL